jgi:hypothetical protein
LKPAGGLAALLLLSACHTTSTAPPPAADLAKLESSTQVAARAFERYYRAENSGAADAYVERARGRGVAAGRTEPCRLPTGAASSRPSVLANPPVAASSIRQRGELVATLGAYLATLAAVADRSNTGVVSTSLSNLETHALALEKAAGDHDTGDLFIDEAAAALRKAVDRLRADAPTPEMTQRLEETDAIVRRLILILANDAARQRAETVDATKLAYNSWLVNRSGAAARTPASELPPCSEPAIFERARDRSFVAAGVVADARGLRLRERANAARAADTASVLLAIAALDDDEMRLLRNPGNVADAARAAASRELLARVNNTFDRAAPR